MYERLGVLVSRHWVLVILFWVALAAAIQSVAPDWDSVTHDGDLAYLPAEMTSVRGERRLSQAFPDDRSKSQFVLVCERPGGRLSSADLRIVDHLASRFQPGGNHGLAIMGVWTPWTEVIGAKLWSRDRRAALVVLLMRTEFMATSNIDALAVVTKALDEARARPDFPRGLRLGVSGSAAIGGDMLSSAKESIRNTELATVVLVVLILLLVYRAPLLVLIPLATIGVSVYVSMDLVALATQAHRVGWLSWVDFKIFKTTKIFVVVLLFGSGTDFCLFFIARYKEELQRGLSGAGAVAAALGHVGEALVGSAMTTVLGLGTMFFADFGKYRNSGPAIALCLLVALAASITLAPALLRALGRAVFWPARAALDQGAPSPTADRSAGIWHRPFFSGFWRWASGMIIARPGLILVASLLVLAPVAARGLSVAVSYDLLSELRSDRPSVAGTRLLGRHFLAGDHGPVTLLAWRKQANLDTPRGEQEIARLGKLLYDMEGVESVRSIAEPLGDPPGYFNPFSAAGQRKLAARKHPRTHAIYMTEVPQLRGEVTRLDVILAHDPFSKEAVALLDRIDDKLRHLDQDPAWPWWRGSEFDFVGATAAVRDLKAVTTSDQALVQKLVVIAVLAVLIVILRRPLVSVYLIVSVLCTYFVTIGATEWVFAAWYEPFEGLDWKVPLFLFVILIAVGQDYNIYLATRVFEEQRRWGALVGLRVAVERTGGIITSCGVIMAGTFVSMMFGTLRGMLELGFALSLGVMLDTIVVRPILVPAFLALVYRRGGEAPPPDPKRGGRVPAADALAANRALYASRAGRVGSPPG